MDEELLTVEDARKRLGIGRGASVNLACAFEARAMPVLA
jgi:hypothetical protein